MVHTTIVMFISIVKRFFVLHRLPSLMIYLRVESLVSNIYVATRKHLSIHMDSPGSINGIRRHNATSDSDAALYLTLILCIWIWCCAVEQHPILTPTDLESLGYGAHQVPLAVQSSWYQKMIVLLPYFNQFDQGWDMVVGQLWDHRQWDLGQDLKFGSGKKIVPA